MDAAPRVPWSCFVDTGPLLGYFDARDDRSAVAVDLLRDQALVTTNFVVDELLALALSRRGPTFALRLASRLWSGALLTILPVTWEDELRAREHFVRYAGAGASFTDCTSFAMVERLRIPVVLAFDRHFRLPATFIVRP